MYGAGLLPVTVTETVTMTKKSAQLRVCQDAMERAIRLKDRQRNEDSRARTKLRDVIEQGGTNRWR